MGVVLVLCIYCSFPVCVTAWRNSEGHLVMWAFTVDSCRRIPWIPALPVLTSSLLLLSNSRPFFKGKVHRLILQLSERRTSTASPTPFPFVSSLCENPYLISSQGSMYWSTISTAGSTNTTAVNCPSNTVATAVHIRHSAEDRNKSIAYFVSILFPLVWVFS